MNTIKESLINASSAISNVLIECSNYLPINQSTSSISSGEESPSEIESDVIKEEWGVLLSENATLTELKTAIIRCKELIIDTAECSPERKWLVRNLVELRFRAKELEDALKDPTLKLEKVKVILGHHIIMTQNRSTVISKKYCENCTGVIWSLLQASYFCKDCNLLVHHKCVNNIKRICAYLIASERKYPIKDICPEVGLAAQLYKCAECQTPINLKKYSTEARLCDYNGLYYCTTCHWNDTSIIPARILHNWDFKPRKVCRSSLQEIFLLLEKPVIELEKMNPKLFTFLQKLSNVKKIRENLVFMKKYLIECRNACNAKIIEHESGNKRHLIQSSELYSISDLFEIESESLIVFLNKIFYTFEDHIRSCEICSGKGYICEICSNDEIIYPFNDGTFICDQCSAVHHKACSTRKNMLCPKCIRLEERKNQQINEIS